MLKSILISVYGIVMLSCGLPGVYGQLNPNLYKELEFFVGAGTTHYLGDVGGSSNDKVGVPALFDNLGLDLINSRIALSLGSRYAFTKNLAVSASINPIWYYGSDEDSEKESRGYYFDSYLLRAGGQLEYYFANRLTGFAPFGFAGLGGMLFWVDSRDTRGQRAEMRGSGDFMFGLGTRFPGRSRLTHSVHLSFHYYFTDLVDGLAGSLKRNDTGFTLMYQANLEWLANFIYDHRGLIRN